MSLTKDECQVSFTWPYFRVARNFVTFFLELQELKTAWLHIGSGAWQPKRFPGRTPISNGFMAIIMLPRHLLPSATTITM